MPQKVLILTNTGDGLKWTVPADWNNDNFQMILMGGGQAGMTPDAATIMNGWGGASGWIVRIGPGDLPAALVAGQQLDFKVAPSQAGSVGATVTTPALTDFGIVDGSINVSTVTWAPGNDTWIKNPGGSFLARAPGGQTNGNRVGDVIGSSWHTQSNGGKNLYLYGKNQEDINCHFLAVQCTAGGAGGAGAPGDPYLGIGFPGGIGGQGLFPSSAGGCHPFVGYAGREGAGGGAGVTGLFGDPDGDQSPRNGAPGAGGETVSVGGDGGDDEQNGNAGGAYYVSTEGGSDVASVGPGGGGGGGFGGCVFEWDHGSFPGVNPPPIAGRHKGSAGNTLIGAAVGANGANGGNYGAGGGGGGNATSLLQANMGRGGTGAQGFIVIMWNGEAPPPVKSFTRFLGV